MEPLQKPRTHLVWIKGLLRSFRRALTEAFTHRTLFISLGYLSMFGGIEPCTESELTYSLFRSSWDSWQQMREISMLLRSRLMTKLWW